MADTLLFRVFEEGDYEQYKSLFKEVYSKDIDENFFKWKHIENPASIGNPLIYLVFTEDGRLVGANSFFPDRLVYGDKEYMVVQSGDTMVSKDFRGKGIFKKTLQYAMKDLKERGYSLIFGFANNQSYPGFKRLGFDCPHQINYYYKILSYETIVRSKLKNIPILNIAGKTIDNFNKHFSKNSNLKVESCNLLDDNVVTYFQNIYKDTLHIKRDKGYFSWKYKDKNTTRYETLSIKDKDNIIGIFVVRIEEQEKRKFGTIIDYCIVDREKMKPCIKVLNIHYRNRNFDNLVIWDMNDKNILEGCSKNLYIKKNNELYFIVKLLGEELDCAIDINKWHLVNGDADTA